VLRLWDVTRGKMACAEAAVRDRETEMETREDRHAMELKVAGFKEADGVAAWCSNRASACDNVTLRC
jgi:hypothetical protein